MNPAAPVVAQPNVQPRMVFLDSDDTKAFYFLVIEKVARLTLLVLIPIMTAIGISNVLPFALSAIVLPFALAGITFASVFMFAAPAPELKGVPFAQYFPAASCGIENRVLGRAANNCWANALLQTIRMDKKLIQWIENAPAQDDLIFASTAVPVENLQPGQPMPDLGHVEENLRPQVTAFVQRVQAMAAEDRAKLLQYVNVFRNLDDRDRAGYLSLFGHLHNFYVSYKNADDNFDRVVEASSQVIRLALSRVTDVPQDYLAQFDPAGPLNVILSLFPPEMVVEERKTYDTEGLPAILGHEADATRVRREPPGAGFITLPLRGDQPTVQGLFYHKSFVDENDPENTVNFRGVDGQDRRYRLKRTETQLANAPSSLWFQLGRFDERGNKNQTPVELNEVLEISTKDEGVKHYKLDGFIVHKGATRNKGHYISYIRELDENGNDVWYKNNDAVVTKVEGADLLEAKKLAYIPHYSRI